MISRFKIRVGSVVLPVIDCTAWVVRDDAPVCRKELDLTACKTCGARESRQGDYGGLREGTQTPPPPRVNPPVPAPAPSPRLRGLGDVVAAATSAVGIKPCGGCKKRQEALNRLVPFAEAETPPATSGPSDAAPTPPAPTDAP